MWLDAQERFHILTHAHGGRHFFSADARHWSPAPTGPNTQAYPLSANFTDGSIAPYLMHTPPPPHPTRRRDQIRNVFMIRMQQLSEIQTADLN